LALSWGLYGTTGPILGIIQELTYWPGNSSQGHDFTAYKLIMLILLLSLFDPVKLRSITYWACRAHPVHYMSFQVMMIVGNSWILGLREKTEDIMFQYNLDNIEIPFADFLV